MDLGEIRKGFVFIWYFQFLNIFSIKVAILNLECYDPESLSSFPGFALLK